MTNIALCKELSKKLAQDFGATPFSLGQVSLTHKDLLVKSTLKVQDEKGVVKNIPMWYGEALGMEGKTCCLLTALDPNPDSLEIACIIGFKDVEDHLQEDAVRAGFRYDWSNEDDKGTLIVRAGDKWLEVSLAQRLQLALGFEHMVQDGVMWQPGEVPEEFRKNLSEIIEVDEEL